MSEYISHISVEDEDGQVIGPVDYNKGNCFSTFAMPRKGDKIQIQDRNGEWEVVDIIHTLVVGSGIVPVSLRVRDVSRRIEG